MGFIVNRRVLIRNLSLTAAGAVLAGRFDWREDETASSYSIVTHDPETVIDQMRRVGCSPENGYRVERASFEASRQDLAVVRHGRVLQPDELRGWEADLMSKLRRQHRPGTHLITIERRTNQPAQTVEFQVEGRLLERASLGKDYRRIEIPGRHGLTVFSIDEGRVAVHASSCRHQLCRNCGSVRSGRIVCAPNRLVATVSGGDSVYDAISG